MLIQHFSDAGEAGSPLRPVRCRKRLPFRRRGDRLLSVKVGEECRHGGLLCCLAVTAERIDERLHLAGVEPQSVAEGTAVEVDLSVGAFHLNNAQLAAASWTAAFSVPIALGFGQGAGERAWASTGPFRDPSQFSGIQPDAAAIHATVNLDAVELEPDERFIANRAHLYKAV